MLKLLPCLVLMSTSALACDGGPLFELMDAPLPLQAGETFDVAEVQSTEGGEWKVYFAPDGKTVQNLERHDYGEGGRWAARLIVSSPDAYAIRNTTYGYSAPNNVSGATTIREETDIFIFCAGKLHLPEEEFGLDPEYRKKAAEALKTFDAPEVAKYVSGLKR